MHIDVHGLIEQLRDPDFRIRVMAIRGLGEYKDGQSIASLIEAFQDNHVLVRTEATFSLVRIGEPSILPLINALYVTQKIVRDMAIITLGKIGTSTVQPLITRIIEEYPIYRRETDRALIKVGRSAIKPLRESLLKEIFPDKDRILLIINKIDGSYGHKGEKDPSVEYLNSDKKLIVKLIKDNILSVETFSNIINSQDEDFKVYLINILQEGDGSTVPFLVTMLDCNDYILKDLIKSTLIEMSFRPGIGLDVLGKLYEVKKHASRNVNKDIDEVIKQISRGEQL